MIWNEIYIYLFMYAVYLDLYHMRICLFTHLYTLHLWFVWFYVLSFSSHKSLKLVWKNISKGIVIVHISPFPHVCITRRILKRGWQVNPSLTFHWQNVLLPWTGHLMVLQNLLNDTEVLFTHRSHTSTQPASFFVPRNRTYSVLYIVGVRRSRGWEWRWLHIEAVRFRSDVSAHFR